MDEFFMLSIVGFLSLAAIGQASLNEFLLKRVADLYEEIARLSDERKRNSYRPTGQDDPDC